MKKQLRLNWETKRQRRGFGLKQTTIALAGLLCAFIALFGVSGTARAAAITWGGNTFAGDTDVLTNGIPLYAYDMAGNATTVNGVSFLGTPAYNQGTTNLGLTADAAGIGGHPTIFGQNAFPFNTLSAAYQSILKGGASPNSINTNFTLTLSNLTVGKLYAVQMWVLDGRAPQSTRSETVTSAGGNTITLAYNFSQVTGGFGQYGIGTFTADGTTQDITLFGISPQVNALQVRDVTGTSYTPPGPPPFSIVATWRGASTADSNWSDSTNWTINGVLNNGATFISGTFSGTARQTNTNDLTNLVLGKIALTTPNWNITGNAVTLNGGITNTAAGTSTWGLDALLNVTPTISVTAAGGVLNLTGAYSGAGSLIFSGGPGIINLPNLNSSFTGTPNLANGILNYSSLAASGQNSSLGAGTGINVGSSGAAATLNYVGTASTVSDRFITNTSSSGGSVTLNNNSPNNSSQTFNGDMIFAGNGYALGLGGTSSGTTTFNGQLISSVAGYFNGNLNISGAGIWVFNNLLGVSGTVNVASNATMTLGVNSITVASQINLNSGGVLDVSAFSPAFAVAPYAGYPETLVAGRTNGTSGVDIAGGLTLSGTGGAVLNVAGRNAAGTLTIGGKFTPNDGTGSTALNLDLNTTTNIGSTVNDLIQVNGDLDLSPGTTAVIINPLQGSIQLGQPYTIISYTGTLNGNASGLDVRAPNRSYSAGIVSTATPGVVTVTFNTNAAPPTTRLLWQGLINTNWDAGVTSNWLNGASSDYFYTYDSPFFDDTASQFNVNLVGNLLPTVVTVTNNNSPYTFGGSGQITGPATLVKQGVGTLTLTAPNTYSGGTMISGGTLMLSGPFNATGSGVITNNATLTLNGQNTLFNNAVVGNGTINFQTTALNEYIANDGATPALSGFMGTINIPITTGTGKIGITTTNAQLNSAAVVNVAAGGTFWLSGVTIPSTINLYGAGNSEPYGAVRMDNAILTGPVNLKGPGVTFGQPGANTGMFSNIISDGGNGYGPVKVGTGTITFAGTNTYTGVTTINGGTVSVLGNESAATGGWLLPATASATANFQPGSTIVVSSTNLVQVGSASLGGSTAVTLNSYGSVNNNGTLLLARAGTMNVISNVWMQNGSLSNLPPDVSTLSAVININTYGTFLYNGATPIVLGPSTGSSGSATLTVNGGTFRTGQGFVNPTATTLNGTNITTGTANVILTAGGKLAFSANVTGLITNAGGSVSNFRLGTGGGVIDNGGFNITLPDTIANVSAQTGSLIVTNTGTVVLTGTNTYTGSTTVSGGRLVVNGSLASSATTVNVGTTLGGTGTISGTVKVAGLVTPGGGTNVATLTTGAETWNSGGAYEFSVNNVTNGAGQDLLSINGLLTLPTNSAAFTVKLTSLMGNTPGAVVGFTSGGSYTWTIATASGGITNFTPGAIMVDTTGFANPLTGQFGVTTNGNSLVLVYPYVAPVLTPPTLSGTASYSGGGFNFGFSGPSGQTYKVLASTNLTLPLVSWTVVTSGTFGANPVNYADTGATNGQKFYRVTSP